jgi:uncharacterized membrane protein
MDKQDDRALHERVARLEAIVAGLQSRLQQMSQASGQHGTKMPAESAETVVPPVSRGQPDATVAVKQAKPFSEQVRDSVRFPFLSEKMLDSEYWLNKIGIGLLLFGVAFLFKYSIDQGWLTPRVRVVFGLLLGTGLVATGIRIYAKRRHFSLVVIGGGIATFYITGFAAFQLFELTSYLVTFVFMTGVTLLALFLSLRQRQAILSLIGAIGGFGTPFLLYTSAGNLAGLVAYTCLLLSGTMAIYFQRGWHSLLWLSAIGCWTVFLIGLNEGLAADSGQAVSDSWALQSGIVFGWLVFALLPVLREIVSLRHPEKWQHSEAAVQHVSLLSVSMPLIALAMSMPIWSLTGATWGWITMAASVAYGLAGFGLSRINGGSYLAYIHALAGVLLFTIALCLLLAGDTLFFALASEAGLLHLLGRRLPSRGITAMAHLFFTILGLWLYTRLFGGRAEGTAILNPQALSDFWYIAAAFAASLLFTSSEERKVYRFLAHIAVLAWLLRELSILTNGQGYVTIAWGIYAVALLILGLRLNVKRIRSVAMATLLLVVGKLFVVDLSELETIWRVLLFLGFGVLFLMLSYYFRGLWKSDRKIPD